MAHLSVPCQWAGRFRTASVDISDRRRPPGLLAPRTLRSLQTCDLLKQEYRRTGDRTFLDAYRKVRATIQMRQPSAIHQPTGS